MGLAGRDGESLALRILRVSSVAQYPTWTGPSHIREQQ